MHTLNAEDIRCRADEAGAETFEFEQPSVKTRVLVRSHDRALAERRANEYFKQGAARECGEAELF